jgi:hypothetical protein
MPRLRSHPEYSAHPVNSYLGSLKRLAGRGKGKAVERAGTELRRAVGTAFAGYREHVLKGGNPRQANMFAEGVLSAQRTLVHRRLVGEEKATGLDAHLEMFARRLTLAMHSYADQFVIQKAIRAQRRGGSK